MGVTLFLPNGANMNVRAGSGCADPADFGTGTSVKVTQLEVDNAARTVTFSREDGKTFRVALPYVETWELDPIEFPLNKTEIERLGSAMFRQSAGLKLSEPSMNDLSMFEPRARRHKQLDSVNAAVNVQRVLYRREKMKAELAQATDGQGNRVADPRLDRAQVNDPDMIEEDNDIDMSDLGNGIDLEKVAAGVESVKIGQ